MKDNWQKDIHNRLGNYEINEPEGLWTDIRKEMAGAMVDMYETASIL